MRVIIDATGYRNAMEPLINTLPTPLLQVINKPIIFHIIEYLIQEGVVEFHLILSHYPELIEEQVGDGARWGVKIVYHLAKYSECPYHAMRPFVSEWKGERVILSSGDCLPHIHSNSFAIENTAQAIAWIDQSKEWLGWAILSTDLLASFPVDLRDNELIFKLAGNSTVIKTQKFLSTRTYHDLKQSNLNIISQPTSNVLFPTTVRMIEPLVWISRGASIHPTAKIEAPVFIGENCQIKEGAQIGPNTLIESECIVDNQSLVQDALVCQHSYIGEALEITNCIVDRTLLINLAIGANITVHDEFIISELVQVSFKKTIYYFFEKLTACLLLLILSPLYLLMSLISEKKAQCMLNLPSLCDEEEWSTFDLLYFAPLPGKTESWFHRTFKRLPSLVNIVKGSLHFVGVHPRTTKEAEKLSADWLKLILRSKNGIITLSCLNHGENFTLDELYASEAYYSVHQSIRYDLKLMVQWLFDQIFSLKR